MADENRSFRYGDSVFHDGAGPLAKHVPMVFIQGVQARRGGHLGACVQSERLSDEDAAHYAAELGEANRSDNLAKMQAVYMTTALVLVHEGGGFLPHTNESDVKWQLYLVDPEDLRAVEAGSKQAERCARGLRVPDHPMAHGRCRELNTSYSRGSAPGCAPGNTVDASKSIPRESP